MRDERRVEEAAEAWGLRALRALVLGLVVVGAAAGCWWESPTPAACGVSPCPAGEVRLCPGLGARDVCRPRVGAGDPCVVNLCDDADDWDAGGPVGVCEDLHSCVPDAPGDRFGVCQLARTDETDKAHDWYCDRNEPACSNGNFCRVLDPSDLEDASRQPPRCTAAVRPLDLGGLASYEDSFMEVDPDWDVGHCMQARQEGSRCDGDWADRADLCAPCLRSLSCRDPDGTGDYRCYRPCTSDRDCGCDERGENVLGACQASVCRDGGLIDCVAPFEECRQWSDVCCPLQGPGTAPMQCLENPFRELAGLADLADDEARCCIPPVETDGVSAAEAACASRSDPCCPGSVCATQVGECRACAWVPTSQLAGPGDCCPGFEPRMIISALRDPQENPSGQAFFTGEWCLPVPRLRERQDCGFDVFGNGICERPLPTGNVRVACPTGTTGAFVVDNNFGWCGFCGDGYCTGDEAIDGCPSDC